MKRGLNVAADQLLTVMEKMKGGDYKRGDLVRERTRLRTGDAVLSRNIRNAQFELATHGPIDARLGHPP
jgi:hypothetical protein